MTDKYISRVEDEIRSVIPKSDLQMIVSNIGITPDLSAIYTTNSAMHTAFVQVNLSEEHQVGSYEYMERVRRKLARELPELSIYLSGRGLVDSVVNQGLPAPLDIQVSDNDLAEGYGIARKIALQLKGSKRVSDVLIPQDIDYPGLELNIDRQQASLLGLSPKGCGGQRDHRADLRRHDCAELLDRSEERKQLHADGAVFQRQDQLDDHVGFSKHSTTGEPPRRNTRHCNRWRRSSRSIRRRKWITIKSGG